MKTSRLRKIALATAGLLSLSATNVYLNNKAMKDDQYKLDTIAFTIADEINKVAPKDVDDSTRLLGARALSPRSVMISYKVTTVERSEIDSGLFMKTVYPIVENQFCTSMRSFKRLPSGGVVYQYEYKDKNDTKIASINMSSTSCDLVSKKSSP